MSRTNNSYWLEKFSQFLKLIIDEYEVDMKRFERNAYVSQDACRSWIIARNLPLPGTFQLLKEYLASTVGMDEVIWIVSHAVESDFREYANTVGMAWLYSKRRCASEYIPRAIDCYFKLARNEPLSLFKEDAPRTVCGRLRAVVFDFAGTLTRPGEIPADNTWLMLWRQLGFDRDIFDGFSDEDATNRRQCVRQMLKAFQNANLSRREIIACASSIHLMDGAKEMIQDLSGRGVHICIVSRSERLLIKTVMGDLMEYVDDLQCNELLFNEAGFASDLVLTDFDFDGKARYVLRLAADLHASTSDIVFFGNSANDSSVHNTGARCICLNPSNTYGGDMRHWDDSINPCEDLREIRPYISRQYTTTRLTIPEKKNGGH